MIEIQKNIQKITIEIDTQLVKSFINDKICIFKEITNIAKDINMLSNFFKDIVIEYCNRLINKDADICHKVPIIDFLFFSCNILFSFIKYFLSLMKKNHFEEKIFTISLKTYLS